MSGLRDHLATGATTVARAWLVTRADGVAMGFTDHDRPLAFDGMTFRPDAGLTARAVVQGTGLAVDNSEAMGILSSDAIAEADIEAGRYDGAALRMWAVNWADPSQRDLRFAGTLGEIRRGDGAFHAEIRGLTEALNRPLGRLYQPACAAVLGDARCRFDTATAGFSLTVAAGATDGQAFRVEAAGDVADRWFERGRLSVLTGEARGLAGVVKEDRRDATGRRVVLWAPIRAALAPDDEVRIEAGCDKRADTCRERFANLVNFRGFPDIPGADWQMSVPVRVGDNDGGSRR